MALTDIPIEVLEDCLREHKSPNENSYIACAITRWWKGKGGACVDCPADKVCSTYIFKEHFHAYAISQLKRAITILRKREG